MKHNVVSCTYMKVIGQPTLVRASLLAPEAPAPLLAEQPALVTLPNVELLEVGEDWACSTGVFTWTLEDLQSAIASQDDPFVRTPIVKLGHTDPRFDGQPALASVENLHLSPNGQTLIGDLVGLPLWLAQCMASSYPRRSVEGYFAYGTRAGKEWPFVLTGLALLGEAYPAIDSLEDVKALFSGTPPILIPLEENPLMLAGNPSGPVVAVPLRDRDLYVNATAPRIVQADVSVDDIRTAFYDGPAASPDMFWWWIREIRIDPAEIIVDDDGGNLYRVPYTVDATAEHGVSFGPSQQVKIQYVDVVAAGQSILTKFGNPVAAGRPRVRDIVKLSNKEGTDMQLSDEVLKGLGLTPEATEEEVNTALLAKLTAPPVVEPPAPAPITDISPIVDPAAPVIVEPPAVVEIAAATPPAIPDGMVLIDAATLDEVKKGAAIAASMQVERNDAVRNRVLDDAVKAGKFPPARREHFEALLKADPEGTTALIAVLATGMIPIEERGTDSTSGTETEGTDVSEYPAAWKPGVVAAQRANSSRVKVSGD